MRAASRSIRSRRCSRASRRARSRSSSPAAMASRQARRSSPIASRARGECGGAQRSVLLHRRHSRHAARPAPAWALASFFVIEGDEYPSSNTDPRSKFLHYHPRHILVTPLAHDHVNVFPTTDDYLAPLRRIGLECCRRRRARRLRRRAAEPGIPRPRVRAPSSPMGSSRASIRRAKLVGRRTHALHLGARRGGARRDRDRRSSARTTSRTSSASRRCSCRKASPRSTKSRRRSRDSSGSRAASTANRRRRPFRCSRASAPRTKRRRARSRR